MTTERVMGDLRDRMAAWLHTSRDHDEHYWPSDEPCRYCVAWADKLVRLSPLGEEVEAYRRTMLFMRLKPGVAADFAAAERLDGSTARTAEQIRAELIGDCTCGTRTIDGQTDALIHGVGCGVGEAS